MTQPRTRKWSQEVTRKGATPDLEKGIFELTDPKRIAHAIKQASEQKSSSFRAAMALLNTCIQRAGDSLSAIQRQRLEDARLELMVLFKRPIRIVH